jgi:hypothetical protein
VSFSEGPSSETEGRINATINLAFADAGNSFYSNSQTWHDTHEEFADWLVEQTCEILGVESLPAKLEGLTKRDVNKYQKQFHKMEGFLITVGDITADEDRDTKTKLVKDKFKAKKRPSKARKHK